MQKIEFKIIVSIILFTIFIVTLERYQLSENLMNEFMESKKSKNELLVKTISPIVALNLSLGLDEAYNAYLDNIILDNSDLNMVKLVDNDKKVLYLYHRYKKKELNYKSYNYAQKDIIDSITSDKIGEVELIFSDNDYESMIKKSQEITINIYIISSIMLMVFIILVKIEFKNLKRLTNDVLKYNPQKNNFPMVELDGLDEVSLINNAIISMVDKITIYSKQLDKINATLEEKVKKRTLELEIQTAKAEELVKVKANFLANMSHEIRTPMNVILGTTYLMKQTTLDDKQLKYVKKINKVSNNLLIIINDILDFSKLEAGKLKVEYINFDMNTILDNLRYIFEDKANEKGLKFSMHTCYKKSIFYGDSFRIEQVLVNLISNAIKFTDYGEVKFSIECLGDDFIRFHIKDTGIGITNEQKKILFKPFTQADESTTRRFGGTGLGLSISKQIIEQMGGSIWIDTDVDTGSEFIFELKLPEVKGVDIDVKKHSYMDELKDLYVGSIESTPIKVEMNDDKKSELFANLLEASKTKLPKKCEPIIEEIDNYKLSISDDEMFYKIKILFKKYKFKEITTLLEES